MEMIDVSRAIFLVMVKGMWVQDPGFFVSLCEDLRSTLYLKQNIHLTSKVTQKQTITHIVCRENQILWPTLIFY